MVFRSAIALETTTSWGSTGWHAYPDSLRARIYTGVVANKTRPFARTFHPQAVPERGRAGALRERRRHDDEKKGKALVTDNKRGSLR